MKQINTPNGRYYETPNGHKYPGVTTVLGTVWPTGRGLARWFLANAAREIIAHPEDLKELLRQVDKLPATLQGVAHEGLTDYLQSICDDTTAADRGTRIHEAVEAVLTGASTLKKAKKELKKDEKTELVAVIDKLQTIHFQPERVEARGYSESPAYAGTVDLVGEIPSVVFGKKRSTPVIIDLKTSKSFRDQYHAQVAAYCNFTKWGDGSVIKQRYSGGVLHVREGKCTLYKIDEVKGMQDFEACLAMYLSYTKKTKKEEWELF